MIETPSTESAQAPLSAGPQANKIKSMFSSIAGGYDQSNTLLSAGVHHLWRRHLVKYSQVKKGDRVLDCATGTGDLAIEFKKAVGSEGEVIGTDFCAEMLAFAPDKARKLGLDIKFELADVTALPYESNSFDAASISFGIRNVENPARGLAELYRVLKPGGALYVLEFGQPSSKIMGSLYKNYSSKVLSRVGGWITGHPEAYAYLEQSAAKFPCREEFLALMKSASPFSTVEYQTLTFGIVYLYRGIK